MTTTRAFMDTSEIPFLRYFDQRHFRFNVSFQQHFEIAISFFIFQFRTTLIDSCAHSAKVKPFYFEISFYFYRFSELFSFRATTPAYFHIMIYSSTNFIIILPLLQ